MLKFITTLLTITLISSLNFSNFISLEAKEIGYPPDQVYELRIKQKNEEIKNRKITKLKKTEYKIINGEIDTQLGVKMSKEEEKNFNQCKESEKQEKKPRYKNRPTACLKKTTFVNDHITDQDYNLMWQAANQQVEENAGVDMQTELSLAQFVEDVTNIGIINQSEEVSIASSSISSTISSQANSQSRSETSIIADNSSQIIQFDSIKSISFLDIFFGNIKSSAATNDGWRLPYQSGQRPVLTQKPYNQVYWSTGQASHWSYTAFDFANANDIIVNSKAGKVIYKGTRIVNGVVAGFGNHVLVESLDGSVALYAHLNSFNVSTNDILKRGQQIGVQGNTGNSGGSHLHFETWSSKPCGNNNMPESCWLSASYLNSRMLPKFDECFSYLGGPANTYPDCDSGGYPNKEGFWYESINNKFGKYAFRRTGTNQCIDVDNPVNETPLKTWTCQFGHQNQTWEGVPSPYGGTMFERLNTLKCMDAWSPYDGRIVYAWDCYLFAQNHNWYYDGSTKQLKQRGSNFCITRENPSDGTLLTTTTCSANTVKQQWDAVWIS
jgi:Peptidase family M23/Ricin-type beta-trefoil lectin domain